MAKKGIHIKPSKKGTFTAAAKKHGKSVQAFASQVLANKDNYSSAMVKKANFAKNASKWHKGQKGINVGLSPVSESSVVGPVTPYEELTLMDRIQEGILHGIIEGPKDRDAMGYYNSVNNPKKNHRKLKNISETIATLLTTADAAIPGDKLRYPVVRPELSYNPYQYGTGSQAIADQGITISNTGYKKNSKDKNKKQLRIPSNQITMQNVEFPVLGVSNTGDTQMMLPGYDYNFDGDYVDEFPMAKNGKKLSKAKAKEILRDGTAHGKPLTDAQKRYFGWVAGGSKAQNGKVFTSQEQIDQANAMAQRFAEKNNLLSPSQVYAARNIGDPIPPVIDLNPGFQKKLPTTVPNYVGINDIQSFNNIFWYTDPQTGESVDIDPSVVRQKRFQPKLNYGGIIPDISKNKKMKSGGKIQPLTEDTIQFHGPSHADGGIDIMYGNKGVEVEGDETGYFSQDGSLNIMGNMINPLTNRKFKEDSKRLAKKEQKVNELLDYSFDLVDEGNPTDKWGLLKFNSGLVQMQGAMRKKMELMKSKEHLADMQKAMLELSGEEAIAQKGKVVFPTKKQILGKAQNGASIAQRHNNPGNMKFAKWMEKYGAVAGEEDKLTKDGSHYAKFPNLESGLEAMKYLMFQGKGYKNLSVTAAADRWTGGKPYGNLPADLAGKKMKDLSEDEKKRVFDAFTMGEDSKKYNWESAQSVNEPDYTDLQNYKPSNFNPKKPSKFGDNSVSLKRVGTVDYNTNITEPSRLHKSMNIKDLSLTQIAPELLTLADNQVEPVFMQQYHPDLYQPYSVSFQDQLDENTATFLPFARYNRKNPEALATLAAQKYRADQNVLANEFRTNQGIEQDIVNKNIALLNDAELKNLSLADTQYTRQEQAKSNTKQQNLLALESISNKITQNELEKRTLQVYENLYPYYSYDENYGLNYSGPKAGESLFQIPSTATKSAQVTVREDSKGNQTISKKYPSSTQQDLQNLTADQKRLDLSKNLLNWLNRERLNR